MCERTHTTRKSSQHKRRPPLRPEITVNKSLRDFHGKRYPSVFVMTYNILSQDLISENSYLYDEESEWLDWEYRKRRLLKELISADVDVSCNCFSYVIIVIC